MKQFGLLLFAAITVASCNAGGKGTGGGAFRLLQFVDSGKDSIPRNHKLTFLFSQPVLGTDQQNFPERLKIQNVDTGAGGSNFALAVGLYLVDGDTVHFYPRLPEKMDRSDAGFRADGTYHVFLKGGPDAFQSASGKPVANPQDFIFGTSQYFEDPVPGSPPRALSLMAVDPTTGTTTDLSRVDPVPSALAALDNKSLLDAGRILDPGAGGPPLYGTPWHFDLMVSEAIDPATVVPTNVEMLEIRDDALDNNNQAAPGTFGTEVSFKVPLEVSVVQGYDAAGNASVIVRAIPLETLVDDARYRITFSGNILGIDYRKAFIGDNGLTGDGLASAEPGGLGYTSEFLVYDRPAISGQRVLTYQPLLDGIQPETGQTVLPGDTTDLNTALYDPSSDPGMAVGVLPDFGDGSDGAISVAGGTTTTIDTGDTRNPDIGNPFTVQDLNPDEDYLGDPRPGGPLTYDSPAPYELQISALTVSSTGVLKVVGSNPLYLRVSGITQIKGTIDASGGAGQNGGSGTAKGGKGGAGAYDGATAKRDSSNCSLNSLYCGAFVTYLNTCSSAKTNFPFSVNGNGPGRGMAGGEMYSYYATDNTPYLTGTGGGGASHATSGQAGEDRLNAGGAAGTEGPACNTTGSNYIFAVHNSGVIGVRGQPGPVYGDRQVKNVLLGGSGGGAGGATHTAYGYGSAGSGGAGGGGGGSLTILSEGDIAANGGILDVSGGNGGKGAILNAYPSSGGYSWNMATGGGGGGSGGTMVLISGGDIQLTGAILDATGGSGGPRANAGSTVACGGCNAGGDGGKGFILLMDADGQITGFLPGSSGQYDGYAGGILTIRDFDATRFSAIRSATELFSVKAADPAYMNLTPADILANVATGQSIIFKASSAQSDPDNPLVPDLTTETPDVEVARAVFSAGASTITITGDLANANTTGRDAFLRIKADFNYTNGVEAAVGPYATIDQVTIHYSFNG